MDPQEGKEREKNQGPSTAAGAAVTGNYLTLVKTQDRT